MTRSVRKHSFWPRTWIMLPRKVLVCGPATSTVMLNAIRKLESAPVSVKVETQILVLSSLFDIEPTESRDEPGGREGVVVVTEGATG